MEKIVIELDLLDYIISELPKRNDMRSRKTELRKNAFGEVVKYIGLLLNEESDEQIMLKQLKKCCYDNIDIEDMIKINHFLLGKMSNRSVEDFAKILYQNIINLEAFHINAIMNVAMDLRWWYFDWYYRRFWIANRKS